MTPRDLKDVEFVLLTHLHWDHAGNCDLFPEATVFVQRDELRYAIAPGRFFRSLFLSPLSGWGTPLPAPNLDTVQYDDDRAGPARGARGRPHARLPCGHRRDGPHVLHRGRRHLHAQNLDDDLPPGFHVNVDDAVDSAGPAAARPPTTSCPRTPGAQRRPCDADRRGASVAHHAHLTGAPSRALGAAGGLTRAGAGARGDAISRRWWRPPRPWDPSRRPARSPASTHRPSPARSPRAA
ncbi:MAG: MBL fold metallo-hydrolase [Chloroflexota bacterium]